jgi:acyl-CoA synthetase (AMP-forming)/AMP-acid ligase II
VDPDGFIHLLGRAKDLIIRGGHNIDPAVIEDALLAHPAVTGASAVGRPDPHSGEIPVAYVTLRPGTTGTGPDELIAFAAQHVPERAAAPKDVIVLSALPLTDIGNLPRSLCGSTPRGARSPQPWPPSASLSPKNRSDVNSQTATRWFSCLPSPTPAGAAGSPPNSPRTT